MPDDAMALLQAGFARQKAGDLAGAEQAYRQAVQVNPHFHPGWANLAVKDGALSCDPGYIEGRHPNERAFARELEAELDRLRFFLRMNRSELRESE